MTMLYLVRHGETDWNLARRIQGSTDIELNSTGRQQAAATGLLMSRRRWDAVVTSPLARAVETATIIGDAVGIDAPEIVEELAERNYGEAEGMTGAEIELAYPPGTDVPGRESREAVTERVLPALVAIAERHPGQSIIVVSHGGVIRSVLKEVDPGTAANGHIRNGSVHSFRHIDGALELVAFDDPLEAESLDPHSDDLTDQNAMEARESD